MTTKYWTVDCGACLQHYEQAMASLHDAPPRICGACGSPRIRLRVDLFDRRNVQSEVNAETETIN